MAHPTALAVAAGDVMACFQVLGRGFWHLYAPEVVLDRSSLWRRGGLQLGISLAPEVGGVGGRWGAREMRDAEAECLGEGRWAALDGRGAAMGLGAGRGPRIALGEPLRPRMPRF